MNEMTSLGLEIERRLTKCWTRIFEDVRDAVVYMDHSAIECLHWYTTGKGYIALKDAGAIAVYEFGMYHFRYVQAKDAKKATIVSTSGDPQFYQRTLKMILAKNTFRSCIVYCGAPSSGTQPDDLPSPEEKLDYIKLKGNIKSWMTSDTTSQEPTVNIAYAPIFVARISKNLFVTPPFGDLMPPLDGKMSNATVCKLKHLAYSFRQLFSDTRVRLDVYSVGKFSEHLASNLDDCGPNADHRDHVSETSEIGVSLILIDRTLDLGTPTGYDTESFLAKILRTLPRLPYHDNDVAINMAPAFGTVTEPLQTFKVPGCLAGIGETLMDDFIYRKEKKLLDRANHFLHDMGLTKDSPKLRTPARISGHSLEKVLGRLQAASSTDPVSIQMDKLLCISATIEASTSQKTRQLELLTSLEKLVLQSLSASRESSSILVQLANVIRTRNQRGLDMENLLALLVHVYAIAGTQIKFSEQQERQLQESIADAIFDDSQALRKNPSSAGADSIYRRTLLLPGGNDVTAARGTSSRIAMRIICTLRSIAEQRSTLRDYRCSMPEPNSCGGAISILEQIAKDVFRTDRGRELRDLRKTSTSLISAGFNLILRGKTKRHPGDNPYTLIYIVGGITAEEAKLVQEVASLNSSDKSRSVMLAGSRLLNPMDIVDTILFCELHQLL